MDETNNPNSPEQIQKGQGSEHYEKEIQELERRLQEKRTAYEETQQKVEHKEILGEVIKERLEDLGVDVNIEEESLCLKSEMTGASHAMSAQAQAQLQNLVNDLFQNGLNHAIEEAKKSGNPYLLVLFRDALALHFYPVLVERGIIKEI